jgi:hypothetical protein
MAGKTCDYCGKETSPDGETTIVRDEMLGDMHPKCRVKFIRDMQKR